MGTTLRKIVRVATAYAPTECTVSAAVLASATLRVTLDVLALLMQQCKLLVAQFFVLIGEARHHV